jgi:hypothetical protein
MTDELKIQYCNEEYETTPSECLINHRFVESKKDIIIINEPIKRYTDHLEFMLVPCSQEVENEKNSNITCESEQDFLAFLEDEEAYVMFFWFDHAVKTNSDAMDQTAINNHDSADAYSVRPQMRDHKNELNMGSDF